MTRMFTTLAAVCLLGSACDRLFPEKPDLTLPPIADVAALYEERAFDGDVSWNGNVVVLSFEQPWDRLRRGGPLWAKFASYTWLYTPATKTAFETWAGIAAVRVISHTPDGDEIGRATLLRTALRENGWRKAHNLLGYALRDGTERPTHVAEFVRFAEQHTEHQYSPRFGGSNAPVP